MSTFQQARELFRFELSLQWRQAGFWLSLIGCMALGVGFAATDMGAADVAVGRIDRNVPYAVLQSLAGLSGAGMFVVLVTVGQAILRDGSTGMEPLIFSRPVQASAYLGGRFLAGYCAALVAVTAGAFVMALTQTALHGTDPMLGPTPWNAFLYGVFVFIAPNLLFVGLVVLLLGSVTRRMGATFLGLLPVMVGQDIAEALPVGLFGYRIPALLDPLGLAALNGATHTWTASQYAGDMPGLGGDLLLNRVLWLGAALLIAGLTGAIFNRRTRRVDRGPRGGKKQRKPVEVLITTPTLGARRPRIGVGAPLRSAQFWALLRFEFAQLAGSLSYRVMLVAGLAMVGYSMWRGDEVSGVRLLPSAQLIAQSIQRGSMLTMTLMVVLFSGEAVWRDRTTRMDLTLDSYPITTRVASGAKMLAVFLVLVGTTALFTGLAWGLQSAQASTPAPGVQVLAAFAHESLRALQLAAAAFFLQTLAGGRITGYMAMGFFLALRFSLPQMGYTNALYAFANARLPFLSDMNGFGNGVARWLLTQGYWTLIALLSAIGAGLFWPRGRSLNVAERWGRVGLRLARHGRGSLAMAALACVLCGFVLHRQTQASGAGWSRAGMERFLLDYEEAYSPWRDRPRPEVVDIQADVAIEPAAGKWRVRGRYLLRNQHPQAIEEMLISHDPDFELHRLDLQSNPMESPFEFGKVAREVSHAQTDNPQGSSEDKALGTRVLRFEPALPSGATVALDFDLEFDPAGWGPRPAEQWLVENGTFLLAGPGTHAFFRGAQAFLTLGYDPARELQRTQPRRARGLAPWDPLLTPQQYLERHQHNQAEGQRGPSMGGNDWANAELWIHTDVDQHVLAPGELLERTVEGKWAHHHFKTKRKIAAFFPILSGRYELVEATHGRTRLELYHHPQHAARVDHMIWAMQRSLAYFEEHWGPYPHETLRLGEIPGFAGSAFACSFPGGMMGFTDSMGFRCPQGEGEPIAFPDRRSEEASPSDVDPILWTVAHEVAHQWWDSHVIAAMALGAGFTSESMAQYGSLCVLQAEYGDDMTLRIAEYNRELYLQGRRRADRVELPLVRVDDQPHVHYGKGLVAFHALAQLAGFKAIDEVLAETVKEYAGPEGRPLTSLTLLDKLRAALPVDLQPNIVEWFDEIRFLEAKVLFASASHDEGGRYALSVEGSARSLLTDGDGAEIAEPFTGRLELEISFAGSSSQVRLPMDVHEGQLRFHQSFDARPIAVQLDPRMLHMDRDLADNHFSVVTYTP